MITDGYFISQRPHNQILSTLVDYYFHIDIPVNQLSLDHEFIIPFPRITFGYFFNHPFLATNNTLNQIGAGEYGNFPNLYRQHNRTTAK